jgi:acyl carrier protein
MEAKLRSIFAEALDIDPDRIDDSLSPETNKNWDSFGTVQLVSAVEEKFDVTFDMDELTQFTSFGAVKELLKRHGNA